MIQRSFSGLNFIPRRFRRHVYLRDQSIEVMRDILQSRYLRSNVAHKQLARTSLNGFFGKSFFLKFVFSECNFTCVFICAFICQSTFFILLIFSAEYFSRF